MSVLLGDRKESKFEAITYSIELHDMLILLMQRGFGVNYERMGGNGSAKRIMQEVDKLPIHKFIEKEEEHNEHE